MLLTHSLTHSILRFTLVKSTFSQSTMTDRQIDRPTTRLLELLEAAKKPNINQDKLRQIETNQVESI